jgi:acyl-CoA thioesterase FadM
MTSFRYEIRNAETGQLLTTGETKHVFITKEGKPVKVPKHLYDLFAIEAPGGA